MTEETKELSRKHTEQYGSQREPLLDGLTSDYDIRLFREAQSRACEEVVRLRTVCILHILYLACVSVCVAVLSLFCVKRSFERFCILLFAFCYGNVLRHYVLYLFLDGRILLRIENGKFAYMHTTKTR